MLNSTNPLQSLKLFDLLFRKLRNKAILSLQKLDDTGINIQLLKSRFGTIKWTLYVNMFAEKDFCFCSLL